MIACGSEHSIAVTINSNLHIWGSNIYGQIGNHKASESENLFKIKVTNEELKQYQPITGQTCYSSAAFGSICCVITGSLIFYSNYFIIPTIIAPTCVCGFTCCNCQYKKNPVVNINEETKIKSLVCGAFHNLVLFENGNLWGWGNNEFGQLGKIVTTSHYVPRPIFGNVKKVVAHNQHTLVLCKEGVLYGMGDNSHAQLGNFDRLEYSDPIKIELNVVDVTTINGITLAKTVDGLFYAWGLYKFEEVVEDDELETLIIQTELEELSEQEDNNENKSKSIIKRVRAWLITEPKPVQCRSFNDFIARSYQLTHFTIDVAEENKLINNFSSKIPDNLIDDSELTLVEYVFALGTGIKKEHKEGKVIILMGDQSKFCQYRNCIVSPEENNIFRDELTKTAGYFEWVKNKVEWMVDKFEIISDLWLSCSI